MSDTQATAVKLARPKISKARVALVAAALTTYPKSAAVIADETGLPVWEVYAAIHWLRRHRAVPIETGYTIRGGQSPEAQEGRAQLVEVIEEAARAAARA